MRKAFVRGATLVAAAAILLTACGGGSDGSSGLGSNGNEDDGGGVIQTVGNVPGVSGACESIINLIAATGQIVAGQVPADKARSTIDRFMKEAPDSIKADAEVFATTYLKWVEVLGKYGSDMAKAYEAPEVAAVLEEINSAEVSGAYDRIGEYVKKECDGLG